MAASVCVSEQLLGLSHTPTRSTSALTDRQAQGGSPTSSWRGCDAPLQKSVQFLRRGRLLKTPLALLALPLKRSGLSREGVNVGSSTKSVTGRCRSQRDDAVQENTEDLDCVKPPEGARQTAEERVPMLEEENANLKEENENLKEEKWSLKAKLKREQTRWKDLSRFVNAPESDQAPLVLTGRDRKMYQSFLREGWYSEEGEERLHREEMQLLSKTSKPEAREIARALLIKEGLDADQVDEVAWNVVEAHHEAVASYWKVYDHDKVFEALVECGLSEMSACTVAVHYVSRIVENGAPKDPPAGTRERELTMAEVIGGDTGEVPEIEFEEEPTPSTSGSDHPAPEFPAPTKTLNQRLALASVAVAVGMFAVTRGAGAGPDLNQLAAGAMQYDAAIANGRPTVVEFYADWCVVCREMAKEVYLAEQNYKDKVNFVLLNIDNKRWAEEVEEYGVGGIPHFVFLDSDGVEEGSAVGKLPRSILDENLAAMARGDKLLPHSGVVGRVTEPGQRPAGLTAPALVEPRTHG